MASFLERQLLVWGEEKVQVLQESHVVVVGVGGLGCVVAEQLARSGVGTLTLIDNAYVDMADLGRQVLYSKDDIGEPKVSAAARRLLSLAPKIVIYPLQSSVEDIFVGGETVDTAEAMAGDATGVHLPKNIFSLHAFADCLDNYAARFALEAGLPKEAFLVHAGIEEERGQITTVLAGGNLTLRQLFVGAKQPAPPIAIIPQACSIVGGYQSLVILNNLWFRAGLMGADKIECTLRGYLALIDIADGVQERLRLAGA